MSENKQAETWVVDSDNPLVVMQGNSIVATVEHAELAHLISAAPEMYRVTKWAVGSIPLIADLLTSNAPIPDSPLLKELDKLLAVAMKAVHVGASMALAKADGEAGGDLEKENPAG